MEIKEQTIAEITTTLDELKNILVAHVQKQSIFKVENITVDDDGVVTFSGVRLKGTAASDLSHNGASIESRSYGESKPGRGKGPRGERKNLGLTKWLREQLKDGHKIHADRLVEEAKIKGWDTSISFVLKCLKQGTLKKEMVEVNKDVFQLREVFEKTHNREPVAA